MRVSPLRLPHLVFLLVTSESPQRTRMQQVQIAGRLQAQTRALTVTQEKTPHRWCSTPSFKSLRVISRLAPHQVVLVASEAAAAARVQEVLTHCLAFCHHRTTDLAVPRRLQEVAVAAVLRLKLAATGLRA